MNIIKILASLDRGVSVAYLAERYRVSETTIATIKITRQLPDGKGVKLFQLAEVRDEYTSKD